MVAARSFTCATNRPATADDRFGGPTRWVWIRIYDDVDQLRAAAARLDCDSFAEFWADAEGCFQPPPDGWPPNGYVGVVRLTRPISTEIVVHELVHAAAAVVRSWGHDDLRLAHGTDREEQLAYAYGDLYQDFHHQI